MQAVGDRVAEGRDVLDPHLGSPPEPEVSQALRHGIIASHVDDYDGVPLAKGIEGRMLDSLRIHASLNQN
jgi:hypothetical protein